MKPSLAWLNAIDRIIAGSWWWKFRRANTEKRINDSPEGSPESDLAYATWKRFEFACRFGRPINPEIAEAVEQAARNVNDEHALALLVINKDVFLADGKLSYRQGKFLTALSWSAKGLCFLSSVFLAALLALAPIAIAPKLLAFAVAFSVLIACAYVWELYTSRPLKAAKHLASQPILAEESDANFNVIPISGHPSFCSSNGKQQSQ